MTKDCSLSGRGGCAARLGRRFRLWVWGSRSDHLALEWARVELAQPLLEEHTNPCSLALADKGSDGCASPFYRCLYSYPCLCPWIACLLGLVFAAAAIALLASACFCSDVGAGALPYVVPFGALFQCFLNRLQVLLLLALQDSSV